MAISPELLNIPETIITPHILLRLLLDEDANECLKIAAQSFAGLNEWYSGALSKPNLTLDQVRTYISECRADFNKRSFLSYGVFDKTSGHMIGVGSLHHLDWSIPKGRIGYWVSSDEQGKGYATEIANALTCMSFERLQFQRLEIRTAIGNDASTVVPKRLGYTLDGLFKKNKASNSGKLWDIQIFSRLDLNGLPTLAVDYR